MVVDPSVERAEPGSRNARDNRHADPILQTEANAALERWLLTTGTGESTPVALLQSAMLTVISAGLMLRGSVVLARTRSFTLSRPLGIVRWARRDAATARIAQGLASQQLQRHVGALWQMLFPWALGTAAPAGVDRAKWAVALRRSVRRLFPVS